MTVLNVLTDEQINEYIVQLDQQTKCSPKNNSNEGALPPIKRSNSAPPVSWTSLDEDCEAPNLESSENVCSIYATAQYGVFYYQCEEDQQKKLVLPKCPQRITRRKKIPPTPKKYSMLSPRSFTTPRSFSASKSPTVHLSPQLASENTFAKKESSKKAVKTSSTVKSDNQKSHKHPAKKKQVDNWFEARQMVAGLPQIPENEQQYKQAEGNPPISYENEQGYPNDFRYNDQMLYNQSDSSQSYPSDYGEYSYNGYPSNGYYDEYASNGYSYDGYYDDQYYDGYSYNGYPYKNEYSYGKSLSQNAIPPNAFPAPSKQDMMDTFKANDPQSLQAAIDTGFLRDIITCSDGSRLIQRLIEVASAEEKRSAFNILCPDIVEISKDQFGNYVIQKFFEFGDGVLEPFIIQKLFGNVMQLSLHSFGCRVVQKAIEYSINSPDVMAMLFREIQECHAISKCMYDPNGNHVIQKFIQSDPNGNIINPILKACKGNVTSLAINKFGCRIVQKLLQHSTDEQKHILVKQIIERTIPLSYNAFGNYVIQFLLENDSKMQKEIIARVYKDLLKLSLNKYGSNVVEKCILNGDEIDRETLFNYVCPKKLHKNTRLIEMMKNEYGNYVIQKMIELANEEQLFRFANYTRNMDVKLCSFPFGKYIQSRMDKVMKLRIDLPN